MSQEPMIAGITEQPFVTERGEETPEEVMINWDAVRWPGCESDSPFMENALAAAEELVEALKSARVFSINRAAEVVDEENPTQDEYPEHRFTGRQAVTIIYTKEADNAV